MEMTLEKAEEEYRYRLKNESYRYYEPIVKGEEFLNNFMSGDYFIYALLAANGIGKTTLMINLLSHLMWPVSNKYFQQKLFKSWPYPKVFRIVSDPTTVKVVIIPMMKKVFPKGRYTTKKMGKSFDVHWKSDTGWEGDIMTYDQDVKEFESATVGIVLEDEPSPHPIHTALVARTRGNGIIGIFATPLIGSAWMYDEIVANINPQDGYKGYMTAELEDACKIHGGRGFIEHGSILKMIAQYSSEDILPRVFGKFQHLTGLVFKELNPAVHFIKPFDITDDYVVYQSWDTHPRENEAIVWIAVDRKGRMYVVDELWTKASTSEIVSRIKAIDSKYRVVKRLIDPSAYVDDKRKEVGIKNFAGYLARYHNLVYEPGSKQRMTGIQLMKESMDYQLEGTAMIREPMFYVFNHCNQVKWEFLHWQWQEYSGRTQETRDRSARPQDKDDHFMEAIGRILLEKPTFVEKHELNDTINYDDRLELVDDPFS